MSVVFGIPSDVSSVLLSSWINLADLGKVDTALCNKRFRIEFVNLITSEAIRFRGYPGAVGNNFLVWLKMRGMLIDFIALNGQHVSDYELLQSRNYLRHKLTVFKLVAFDKDVANVLGKFTFKFRSLTQLFLQRSKFLTDACVAEVTVNCPNLILIDFSKCTAITSVSVQFIAARCYELEVLNLAGCTQIRELPLQEPLVGQPPAPAVRIYNTLRNLSAINMSDCVELLDSTLCFILANTKAVKYLNVFNCSKLTDDSLHCIETHSAPTLQTFSVQSCHLFNAHEMSQLLSRCTSLRSVNFRNSRSLHDPVMEVLVQHCKQVEELCLDGEFLHWRVSPEMLLTAVQALGRNLTRLSFGVTGITDHHLSTIGRCCVRLEHFLLIRESTPVEFTDAGVVGLCKHCPLLETFALEKNPFKEITDVSVTEGLAVHCPNLRVFKIVGATEVTSRSLVALATGCRRLQQIDLFDSFLIDSEGIVAVCTMCHILAFLSLPLECFTNDSLSAILDRQFPSLCEVNLKKSLAKYVKVSEEVKARAQTPIKGLSVKWLPPASF